jgi:hypothetical protein
MILFNILVIPLAHANIREGLVGWWKMEEATGVNLVDSSGNGNTGTVVNNPTSTGGCARGKCLAFNASSTYVTVASSGQLNNWSALSISLWFKMTGAMGDFTRIFEKGVNNEITILTNFNYKGEYRVEVQQLGSAGSGSIVHDLTTASSYNDGKWHHLVLTVSSAVTPDVILYMDGVFETIRSIDPQPASKTGNITIGDFGGHGGLYVFSGFIDDVRSYNRALTADEVRDLYFSGVKIKGAVLKGVKVNQ